MKVIRSVVLDRTDSRLKPNSSPTSTLRHRVANMPCAIRRLLLAQMGFSALAALGAIGWSLVQERHELAKAAEVQVVNHVSNALLDAGLYAGLERGLSVIALTTPHTLSDPGFAQLWQERGQSETLYHKLLAQVERHLRPEMAQLAGPLQALRQSHKQLSEARERVRQTLANGAPAIEPAEWFEVSTHYNERLGALQDAFCTLPKVALAPLAGCMTVKDEIFWAGEHAGRIRAILGQAIAAGRPLSRDEQYRLFRYRADLFRRLARLRDTATWFPDDRYLAEAMEKLNRQFAEVYKPLLHATFEAGIAGRQYPLDATAWFARTSTGIESLRALVNTTGRAIDRAIAKEVAVRTRTVTMLTGAMVFLFVGLAALTIQVYRRLFSRLDQLQAAAFRIGRGDLEHPVSVGLRDELTALGGAFDKMRRSLLIDRVQQRETEARLRRANEELQRFTSVVSHDLKAPLRAVHGLSTFIEEEVHDHLSEAGRGQMRLLRERVQRMDDLIDALLGYSRAGRRSAPSEVVDTGELISEVVRTRGLPDGFTLSVGDLPRFTTDRVHLQQVFANLIGNAVEHHDRPDGHVSISCRDLGAAFEFSVTDDGPGIPEHCQVQIFEMFQRLNGNSGQGGTGIGLAVVKKVVERIGGTVKVKSIPGEATTFSFTWPKQLPDEGPAGAVSASGS